MTQKTAVDWLVEQLTAIGELQVPQGSNAVTSIIDEAKKMEKEQIKNAFNQSWHDRMNPYKTADKYYNGTFKSE